MGGMNWKRARRIQSWEEKYAPGTEIDNGRVIWDGPPRDSLAKRAAAAEMEWRRTPSEGSKRKRQLPKKPASAASPRPTVALCDRSLEARLLHQVVMAVINAGRGDILKGIDDLNAYYKTGIPTVADIVGARPETAIITGGIEWDDKVYSFSVARRVNR